jgi:hypothetical protein
MDKATAATLTGLTCVIGALCGVHPEKERVRVLLHQLISDAIQDAADPEIAALLTTLESYFHGCLN